MIPRLVRCAPNDGEAHPEFRQEIGKRGANFAKVIKCEGNAINESACYFLHLFFFSFRQLLLNRCILKLTKPAGKKKDGFKLRVRLRQTPQPSWKNSYAPPSLLQELFDLILGEVVSVRGSHWAKYFGLAGSRLKSVQAK